MKRRGKRILAAFVGAMLFMGTMDALIWAGRQFEFFEDQDGLSIAYINASEGDQWVQALSEEIGICLDPALGKHAELLSERDRLVVCPDTIQFTRTEDGGLQGDVERSRYVFSEQSLSEAPLYVYTGGFTADGYDVRMALIGMDTCQVAGVEIPAFEVAIEVRPESAKFAMLTDEISATMLGQFRWRGTTSYPGEEEPGQAVYLYSSDAGVWFEKMKDFFILTSGGSIPPLMLGMPSGGYFGRVDLCQLWGTANLALLTSDTVRAQLDLYRDNKPWASLSFLYPDGLYQQG